MPMPMTASLFCANSRSASRQPLWTGPISPPSGARVMSSGVSEEARFATAISRRSCWASCEPDSRVRDGECDISDEVTYHGEDRASQRVRQQHVVIVITQAGIEQQSQALEVEHVFCDQVAREQERYGQADQ